MVPVLRGVVSYRDLLDGTVDIADIDRLNEAILIQDENQRRYRRALDESLGNG